MQQCIPFIRFYNLTSEEFCDRILPYKRILPKELYKDLLKYFLKPNNRSIEQSKPRVTEEINEPSISHQKTYNYQKQHQQIQPVKPPRNLSYLPIEEDLNIEYYRDSFVVVRK